MVTMDVLGHLPHDERIAEADMRGEPPFFEEIVEEVRKIKENLESLEGYR